MHPFGTSQYTGLTCDSVPDFELPQSRQNRCWCFVYKKKHIVDAVQVIRHAYRHVRL